MRKIFSCLFFAFLFFKGYSQPVKNSVIFNSNWKFHFGDVTGGQKPGLDEKEWTTLDLPHDWSIEGHFSKNWASGTAFLPGGIGWYRKTFNISPIISNEKIFIYFDGVYKNSEVWINGHYLGKRPNGFASFQYELTPYLKTGGKNIIAVRADHTEFADSRWYTGSGIYRNVYLIKTAPIHIAQWGVKFSAAQISSAGANVKVDVETVNSSANDTDVTLKCTLLNAGERIIAVSSKKISVKTNDTSSATLAFNVAQPQLWSVEHPSLYTLNVSVNVNGRQTDQFTSKVGIRDIKFEADKGFFLNGKNMKLKGVCIHDDAGGLGVAVPEEVWYRRLLRLKELGCNSIRLSHNPHADYLYKLCDEMGFLVMDEAFDEWEVGKNKWIKGWNVGTPGKDGYHEYFSEWFERDTRDMVLRGRNHPSIIMWSIGNEIDYPNDPYTDTILNTGRNPQIYGRGYLADHPSAQRLGQLSKLLVAAVKKYDTSRPVTAALAGVVMSNNTSFPENLDVVGYNYQEYRYAGDHKMYPKRIIYGSENAMSLSAWNAVDSNAYIAGQYLWTGIDYLGEAHQWPSHGNGAGLLNLAGMPKPEYYFRQSLWSAKPMIYIGTAKMPDTLKKGYAVTARQVKPLWNYKTGDKVRVSCFTNCSDAELFLNGQSLGKKSLSASNNRIIYWDVNYQPGVLTVKAIDQNGNNVEHTVQTSDVPYAITVHADLPDNDKSKLAQLIIDVADKNGIPIITADNEIRVKVTGPAKLLGLENGDLNSLEDYKTDHRKLFDGSLIAYVQSTSKSGIVTITMQSPGFKDKIVQLKLAPQVAN